MGDLPSLHAYNRRPRDNHKFHCSDELSLDVAEGFTNQTPGPISSHGVSKSFGGDDPYSVVRRVGGIHPIH